VLEAPAIGLRQVVVEGTGSDVMRAGPGHRRNSPLPGQPGASVVYGHASAFGGPFRAIPLLQPGDTITATTGQGQFTYEVTDVRRPNDPTPAPLPAGGGRLVLVTAEGSDWRTGWAANRIVYVDATLRGNSQLGPRGRPAYIETAEYPLQGDPDAFIPLVLWLQGFGIVAVALVWTRRRWGAIQTWFVGAPVLLACLWGMVESLGQLLPNLS
jgi:sortase A